MDILSLSSPDSQKAPATRRASGDIARAVRSVKASSPVALACARSPACGTATTPATARDPSSSSATQTRAAQVLSSVLRASARGWSAKTSRIAAAYGSRALEALQAL